MKKTQSNTNNSHAREPKPFLIRFPGFTTEEEIGLGDVIKRATYLVGIRQCADCQHRAALLNKWVVFTGRTLR